jgi:hypothetical protein
MKARFLVWALLAIAAVGLAANRQELRWGGSGFDPELKKAGQEYSSKFIARRGVQKGKVEVLADSEKSANKVVAIMIVELSTGKRVQSKYCFKVMHHLTAPWACHFEEIELKRLHGDGKIEVYGDSQKLILGDVIHIDQLNELQN